MKKILGIFLLILFIAGHNLYAANVTSPVVDLGTITYTSSTPGVHTFTVTATGSSYPGSSYSLTDTGDGTATGGTYTAFNVTNLATYGAAKYAHIRLSQQDPIPVAYSQNCGTLAITDLKVTTRTGQSPDHASFAKRGGNPITIKGYENGIYFPFIATVTPLSGKGMCTITQTYSIFSFSEGGPAEASLIYDYIPFSITFSVTIITPRDALEHNTNAALNFGTFCKSTTQNQSLIVNADGSVGAHSMVCDPTPATISADSFTVNLSSAPSYSVNLPATASLNGSNGGELTVSNFTTSCGNSPCTVTGGSGSFSVGGTINVPANSPVGDYEGTYGVSITY
jgi:hypothetical protein